MSTEPRTDPLKVLEKFVADCAGVDLVWVTRGAMDTARADFGLYTQKAVREFIAADGLEHPQHINTKLWENNPNPEPIYVYAFSFQSHVFGYVAICGSPTNRQKWLLKSLKKNDRPDPRLPGGAALLLKVGC